MPNEPCCLCQRRPATDRVDERYPTCDPCLSLFSACEPGPLPGEADFTPADHAPANDVVFDLLAVGITL